VADLTSASHSTLERGHGHCQQEGVPQGIHWLEDANVLDEGLVPQEAEQDSQNDNVNGENNGVVKELLLATGLEKAQHLFIRNTEKKFLIVRWSALSGDGSRPKRRQTRMRQNIHGHPGEQLGSFTTTVMTTRSDPSPLYASQRASLETVAVFHQTV